mmetsp:Transcript_60406/g.107712  ORF Transcript_60406/g.107712 Transcript_60406/m.107712 type:complete len:105 (-) Transcript_60406:318-632(-)
MHATGPASTPPTARACRREVGQVNGQGRSEGSYLCKTELHDGREDEAQEKLCCLPPVHKVVSSGKRSCSLSTFENTRKNFIPGMVSGRQEVKAVLLLTVAYHKY